MKPLYIIAVFAIFLLASGCEKNTGVDETLLRIWVASDEVANRSEPVIFTSRRADGSTVAIATGDFVEIADGIELNSDSVLATGFYVYPGRVRVDSIEDAIAFCDRSTGVKYLTEQGGACPPTTALDSKSEGDEKPKPESEGRSQ